MSRGQRIRYLGTSDGIRLAWAEAGSGPWLVKASNWLSHLEYEWQSPLWRHWIQFFADHFRYVRWDERGCGMSDRDPGALSQQRWTLDLEAVIAAAGVEGRFPLLGISSGAATCVAYAARHPERVTHLLLYGGYARGWAHRPQAEGRREHDAIVDLIRVGWGRDNPAFRQIFTSRFIPGGSDDQLSWFNELCRKTATPEVAAELLLARSQIDVSDQLSAVRAPTLVIHARDDAVCPLEEARIMAAGIPGAQFVELDSRNHILLESEPAWEGFKEAVLEFMGLEVPPPAGEDPAFGALSPREREVLVLLTEGLGNAAIGERLSISEKTVRNHVSNVFDKLGVWSRAQAIVFARDRGFRA